MSMPMCHPNPLSLRAHKGAGQALCQRRRVKYVKEVELAIAQRQHRRLLDNNPLDSAETTPPYPRDTIQEIAHAS